MKKKIEIDKEVHHKLIVLKAQEGHKNLSDTINYLLKLKSSDEVKR